MAGQTSIQLTKKNLLSLDSVCVCVSVSMCQDCIKAIEVARMIGLNLSELESCVLVVIVCV